MNDKKLLQSGAKDDSGDNDGGGSDSDPSEDNMEEEEMAKIIPIKLNASKKKTDAKKQLPIRKTFKQEEAKEQKQQQTQAKKSPTKRVNQGGSFFDRVKLPKSYGMRKVEMVDAWTQTSNRGSDTEDPNKDEGIQVQDLKGGSLTDSSPVRTLKDQNLLGSVERSFYNVDSLRNQHSHNFDTTASQSVIVQNPNKSRLLVPASQKRGSLSPNKAEFSSVKDRMQAMQIIN